MNRWYGTVVLLVLGSQSASGDWPMYKGNPARSAYTGQALPDDLTLRWAVFNAAPAPAWPASNRMSFDRASQAVVAAGGVYYGSSVDCGVYALEAATGKQRWMVYTSAPVRFAPAVWKERVFVASDDGYLYCLAAADGSVLWKKRGGPDDRMLLGNDRLISRWPARGGPVVHDDIVYFAAGIWPSEGIYIYALDAVTGNVLWCNDQSGSIFMGQPHGGAYAASGVGAQGYLVVNDDQLLVPTGRAVPAVFDRGTGKFRYFHLQENTRKGGAATMALGPYFFNAGITYDAGTGKILDPVGAGEVAAIPDGLILSGPKEVIAYEWADKAKKDKTKLQLIKYKGLEKVWSIPDVSGGHAVLVAGRSVVCGGDGQVTIVDRETKKVVWSKEVSGIVHGLAVADGRLIVSTDKGAMYCFGQGREAPAVRSTVPVERKLDSRSYERAVAEIVSKSGVTEGYCVDLGCGDIGLARELAGRTKLHIIAIEADAQKVAEGRANLRDSGLYGSRITILHADPEKTPLPNYLADLVISSRSIMDGDPKSKALDEEIRRLLRPYGGVSLLGKQSAMQKTVRGPLEGAGAWTHQYADPANTCCSSDTLVQGPLGMLWFKDSDLDSPSRHGRAPAPLFHDGRLFVEGTHSLRAVDAYNGRRLWEHPLPNILKAYHGEHLMGTAGTQSNYCVTKDGVYVRAGTSCLRLDLATGNKLAELQAPRTQGGKEVPWGYIACEGGMVFGSLADTRHVVKYTYGKADMSQLFTESVALFALDALTGVPKWTYHAKHSIRHNAIALGGGRVYLIDRPAAIKDLLAGDKTKDHPSGDLVALDAATGREVWRRTENVYGTVLALSGAHDVLLMSYQPTRFKLPSELGGRLAAFRASTGNRLWDVEAKYVTRPLINGRTVYAQGASVDLLTGDTQPFLTKRSYGCGQLAGSANLLTFRSATLGYYDLLSPKGVIDYGGLRPGCWINAIPAGGLVLVPDATSGCQCSYLNQAWIALQPME
jgi:outer membrane protein assembly factor BamB